MTKFVYICINIGVAANTSMCCEALVNTSRIGNNCLVGVSAYCVNAVIADRVVTISYLICVRSTIIGVVSGVEVVEDTTLYGDSTKLFSLVNVEEIALAVV